MALDVSVSTRDAEISVPVQLRPAPSCVMVIFGASGDLTHRKLIPALFDLHKGGLLSKQFSVLGFSRSTLSDDDFRRTARDGIESFSSEGVPDKAWQEFENRLHYISGQFDNPASYQALRDRLTFELAHTEGGVITRFGQHTLLGRWRFLTPELASLCRAHGGVEIERHLMDVYIDHHRPTGLQDHKPSLGVIASPPV